MAAPQVKPDDQPPRLRFEQSSKEDRNATIKEGRIVYKPVSLVYVSGHGDTKTEVPYETESWVNQLAERLHRDQISQNFHDFCVKSYERWKANEEAPVDGTPIKGWQMLTSVQQRFCLDANINTVERLADCTEDALGNIGMGARELKKKAIAYLEADLAPARSAQRINSLEADNVAKDEKLSELEKKLAELSALVADKPKNKGGRPRKEA